MGTPPLADPAGFIRQRLKNREKNFLTLAQRVIFSDPANPYYEMFRLAGCAYEDLAALVNRDGLERALASIHHAGVWLSHDEFKGQKPIVRSNREIPVTATGFRNPQISAGTEGVSSGSRSSRTTVIHHVHGRIHSEARNALAIREFEVGGRPFVVLKPVLPSSNGLFHCASLLRLGCVVDRWFSPMSPSLDSAHYRLATNSLVVMARCMGVPVPFPRPADDYAPVSLWLARRREQGIFCVVLSSVSAAVRVAAVAHENGLDIRDALFFVGGETLTDSKRTVIESAGAKVFPRYTMSEVGGVGWACRHMTSSDCTHLNTDSLAVISHRRPAPLSGIEVNSLLFTTLLPYAPSVLINCEMEDSGVLDEASCDCTFSRIGLTQVVRHITSFGKLTGHGVTLVGTDVVRVLEEVLPRRFGGCATDYQLVEWDGNGQARLVLRVSRRVSVPSLDTVRNTFLHEVRRCYGGELASRVWRDASAIDVVNEDPIVTGVGKILPLHLMGSSPISKT